MKRELLDHKTCNDLRFACDLQRGFLRKQLLLTDEKGEQLDMLPVKRVVHIPQPLLFILVVALCLVAKEQNRTAARARSRFADPQRKTHTFCRVGAGVWIMIADGFEQVCKKWPLRMPWLVLALGVIACHFGILPGEQQSDVFYRARLADSGSAIDQRAHNPVTKATQDEFVERFDGWRCDTIISGH
jgi:hypothetical protein